MKIVSWVLCIGLLCSCASNQQQARRLIASTANAIKVIDQQIVDQYNASGCSEEQDAAVLQECIDRLSQQVRSIVSARDTLEIGESLVDMWESENNGGLQQWARSMIDALNNLVEILTVNGVDVPPEYTDVITALGVLIP